MARRFPSALWLFGDRHVGVEGMSLVNLHVLEETELGGDAYTSSTLAQVQIGPLAWQWRRSLVFVRLLPAGQTDPMVVGRFRTVLAAWRDSYLPNNPTLFHADAQGDAVAVFEHEPATSLDSMFGGIVAKAPLARATAEDISDAVFEGLRARHQVGFAHGAVGMHGIGITESGVTLGIGRPWDPGARAEDDLRRAEQLRRDLFALARAPQSSQGTWLELAARLRPR